MKYKIENILKDNNIPNEIKVRTKNIYGIYKRLHEGEKLSDIHDLFSLKIMVDEIDDCYRGLRYVHSLYHPINSKFKDYICNPKTNMYSSLHTTVFGPEGRLIQTQIRTFDMDKIASFGLTAYFDINKGDARKVMQEDLKNKYPFLVEYFEAGLKNNSKNIAHSILFYGQDIEAQYDFATEIARLLNCKESRSEDCSCLNCNWVKDKQHPAVLTVSKIDVKNKKVDVLLSFSLGSTV